MRDVAYGDGTITKRSDGRLQVTVNVGGKRRFAMVPARLVRTDPKAARRKAEELRRELVDKRDAGIEPSSQTLTVFLRSWVDGLRDAKRQRVRPRTLDHYALIVERHIIPALGKHRLDRSRSVMSKGGSIVTWGRLGPFTTTARYSVEPSTPPYVNVSLTVTWPWRSSSPKPSGSEAAR
jgi:hypothetical protein